MLQKILLAADGSAFSMKAAEMALEIASKNQAEVEIFVVAPRIPFIRVEGSDSNHPDEDDDLFEMKKIAGQIIDDTAKIFREQQITFHSKIVMGDAAESIIIEAEKEKTDLIIIGTRGQSGIARFFLGSVSARVVNHAPCSVLIVR